MDDEALLWELERVARRLGIEVRYEDCEGRGGMGLLRGRRVIFVDERRPPVGRAEVIASCLAQLDLEGLFIPPRVREFIERHGPFHST